MISVPSRWMFRLPPPSAELHEAALVASEAQRLGIPWSGQPFEEVKAKVEAKRGSAEVKSTILRDPFVELMLMPVDQDELRRVLRGSLDRLSNQPLLVQDVLELGAQLGELASAPSSELKRSLS